MKRPIAIFLLLGVLLVLISPLSSSAGDMLRIGGVGSALATMKSLGKAFEKSNPGVGIRIFPSLGSSGGIKAVSQGKIDIALSGRPLTDDEKKLGLSAQLYAKTPFILVARQDRGVMGFSLPELIKIYRGEIQRWPDGQRIRLVLRPYTDTDTMILRNISPLMSEAVDRAHSRPGMLMGLTDQDNADIIEKTPGALGFSTLTQVVSEKRRLIVLFYNGWRPSVSALADGSYPLVKELYIITGRVPSGAVRKFIDFVRSKEGEAILEKSGNLAVR